MSFRRHFFIATAAVQLLPFNLEPFLTLPSLTTLTTFATFQQTSVLVCLQMTLAKVIIQASFNKVSVFD